MEAIIRFLQDTGFYLFTQGGNWRCLVMIGIACVLLYLGIVKKFEPLLLVPIAFGMLITNLPGANMFHEIFFAGGHIHWDIIGGKPITAELLSELYNQGVAENVLSPYLQQLMTAAQTMFSPEAVSSTIAEITASATDGISAFGAQLEALVQAEQAAAYYGMTLSDITITPGLVDILYLGVKLGIYPCLIFMGVGAMTDFGPLIANPKSLLLGAAAQLGIFITFVGCRFMGFTGPESSAIGIIGGRPHSHFRHRSAGTGPVRPHRRGGVFLHGPGPRDPASHHEAADHGEGAPDRHEAPPGGQQEGEDHLPHRSDHLRGAAGALRRPPHCLPHAGQPL